MQGLTHRRLAKVFPRFLCACILAASPTSHSPFAARATRAWEVRSPESEATTAALWSKPSPRRQTASATVEPPIRTPTEAGASVLAEALVGVSFAAMLSGRPTARRARSSYDCGWRRGFKVWPASFALFCRSATKARREVGNQLERGYLASKLRRDSLFEDDDVRRASCGAEDHRAVEASRRSYAPALPQPCLARLPVPTRAAEAKYAFDDGEARRHEAGRSTASQLATEGSRHRRAARERGIGSATTSPDVSGRGGGERCGQRAEFTPGGAGRSARATAGRPTSRAP